MYPIKQAILTYNRFSTIYLSLVFLLSFYCIFLVGELLEYGYVLNFCSRWPLKCLVNEGNFFMIIWILIFIIYIYWNVKVVHWIYSYKWQADSYFFSPFLARVGPSPNFQVSIAYHRYNCTYTWLIQCTTLNTSVSSVNILCHFSNCCYKQLKQ